MQNKYQYWLGIGALVAFALVFYTANWRRAQKIAVLQSRLQAMEAHLELIERQTRASLSREPGAGQDVYDPLANRVISEHTLERDLALLGSRNVLHQYEAGQRISEYGPKVVPGLLQLLESGSSRSQQAALLLLSRMDSPKVRASLRETALEPDNSGKVRAAAIGILSKARDMDALPVFAAGVTDDDDTVRAAAITGLRRVGAVDALALLAGRLGMEKGFVQRELVQAIAEFARKDQNTFLRAVEELPARQRFEVCRVVAGEAVPGNEKILEHMLNDKDPRVALTAARLLQQQGSAGANRKAQELLSNPHLNSQLQGLIKEHFPE